MAVTIKFVDSLEEIRGIKRLHDLNLKKNLTPEEQREQGFVTFEYTLEFLQTIHKVHPSVIAVDHGEVVGYALVVTPESKKLHPLITDFVAQLSNVFYNGKAVYDSSYCLVGQLCVSKTHTGQGLVQRMYNAYRDEHASHYDYLVTDVDSQNPRSLKAHLKTGFKVMGSLEHEKSRWDIVLWDWKQ